MDLRQEAVVVLRPGARWEVIFAFREAMLQRTQLQELLEGLGEADARGASISRGAFPTLSGSLMIRSWDLRHLDSFLRR